MRLRHVVTTMLFTFPVFAQTLAEAVQRGLIANPQAIFNINKDAANFMHFKGDTPKDLLLKTQGPANELALGVVHHYLNLSFEAKRLELAKTNLRLLRGVYLDKQALAKQASVQKQVAEALAQAEAELLKMQTKWQIEQNNYAKVVGKWPKNLQDPPIPDNNVLPLSLGQAIEQGLDNYPLTSSGEDFFDLEHWHAKASAPHLEKRSILELTKSIRAAWNDWTIAGLDCNLARKASAEANANREAQLASFKTAHHDALKLLEAQAKFYLAATEYNHKEQAEVLARYRLLASIGALVPFINSSLPENQANKETIDPVESLGLAQMDKISYPYPNYKPEFSSDLANTMEMSASLSPSSMAWYVSAGSFKNKANAVALVSRLKGLGFMAFLEMKNQEARVLVGPYDFPPHALTGMKRLKDMAHLQGALVVARTTV